MTRIARGVAALLALGALLFGVPFALSTLVGRPWPRPLPSVETIWASIQSGDISDATVIKALALLIWIAWARLAVSVVIEIGARLAGADAGAPRVTGLGSAQKWAAGLVAAVVLLVGVGPRGATAATTPVSSSGARAISAALLQADPVRPNMAAPAGYEVGLGSAAAAGFFDRIAVRESITTHIVQRHESFWSIAEDELGDGARWRELVAVNRGREVAPGVIFDGTPERLLPGWILIVPSNRGVSGPIVSPDQVPVPSLPAIDAAQPDHSSIDTVPADAVVAPTVAPVTVRVEPGDTLSGIADERLGDPAAWPRLWDANRDRSFDGRVFDDPNLILAGWELIVPAVMSPPPVLPLAPATESAPTPPAEPALAPSPQPDVAPIVDIDRPFADPPIVSPPVVSPPVVSPPTASPPIADPPVVSPPVVSPPTQQQQTTPQVPVVIDQTDVSAATDSPTVDNHSDGDGATDVSIPTGLGAAVLLSGGVMAAVVGRRRRRMRSATVHARLVPPSALSIATETVLRSLAESERIARLDIVLRAAASALAADHGSVAVLGAIVSLDGEIDVLLSGAAAVVPEPWTSVTAHRWRLAARVGLEAIANSARHSNQPCPALAHLGATTANGSISAELFVDLEALGLLVIEADQASATNVLRAIAAGVAVSPMSEIANVIETGLADALLGHHRASHADSLDMALDIAASAIGSTAATTSATLRTFTLRARHVGGDAWEPAIVFASGRQIGEPSDSDLVSLTDPAGRGLAVVVDRAVEGATWRLVQGPLHWVLQPLGIEVAPVGLSLADLDNLKLLLNEADQSAVELADDIAIRGLEADPTWQPAEWTEPQWAVMVRLLGPVEVVGAGLVPVEFERSKALELVVWMSQHRDRSTRGAARTALWEVNVRDATFANVVSDARRALARQVASDDGVEWIGRTLTEALPLHPSVTTDAELLADRLAHARRQDPDDAIATLRPGLELVRDIPFSTTSYLWPDTEGITSQLILLVTSAATVLAGHYLAAGDTEGVFWATGQGLKVLAGHEELLALRMRAHARHGDLAGVRQEWESYERTLSADLWADAEPAPKLVALRRELLASSMMAS